MSAMRMKSSGTKTAAACAAVQPGQEQYNQREKDAAGMKSPRQNHPTDKSAIIKEAQGR
jgi:hypothetical protein